MYFSQVLSYQPGEAPATIRADKGQLLCSVFCQIMWKKQWQSLRPLGKVSLASQGCTHQASMAGELSIRCPVQLAMSGLTCGLPSGGGEKKLAPVSCWPAWPGIAWPRVARANRSEGSEGWPGPARSSQCRAGPGGGCAGHDRERDRCTIVHRHCASPGPINPVEHCVEHLRTRVRGGVSDRPTGSS